LSDLNRVEIERRLSKDEYLTLLLEADTEKRQIRKTSIQIKKVQKKGKDV
jgi:hypothetical protein